MSKLLLWEDLPPEACTSKRKSFRKGPTDAECVDPSKQPPSDHTTDKQSSIALTAGVNSGDSVHHDQ